MGDTEILPRFEMFLRKVEERVSEILAEAEVGFDQVMAYDVTDPVTMAGAVTAFESRMKGLVLKIADAQTKLAGEVYGSGAEALHARAEALCRRIEIDTHEMRVAKRAKAARLLQDIVEQERNTPRYCSGCKGLLIVEVTHAPSSPVCPFCGAVNQVQPAAAVTNFYYAGGTDALAEAAALDAWRKMTEEAHRVSDMRSPSAADEKRAREAAEAYFRTLHTVLSELHPDRPADKIDAEVRGAMSAYSL